MKLSTMMSLVNATIVTEVNEEVLEKTINAAFSSDLMSDVLAYVTEDVMLVTALAHVQTLRTAEMLDIRVVLCTRGKHLNEDMITLARQNQIILLQTMLDTYEVSGILYNAGLTSARLTL